MRLSAKPLRALFSGDHAWQGPLLAVLVAVLGIFSVSHYLFNQAREDGLADLRVIARLQADEIERWLEQHRTSVIQPESGYLARAYAGWLAEKIGAERDRRLREAMRFYLLRHVEAEHVMVLDTQQRFVLSTDPAQTAMPLLPVVSDQDGAQLVDFYRNAAGEARLGFCAPLALREGGGRRLLGYMLIEIDPQRALYPYLLRWPGSSQTGENLLYRPLPDEIEYLSPLRFAQIRPLDRKPRPRGEAPVSIQQRLERAATEGRNFRGEVELRALFPVRGTSWFVSATQAGSEVYARAWRNSVAFGVGLLALLAAALRLQAVARARAGEAARLAQQSEDVRLLRDVVDAMQESVLLLDAKNRIILINQSGAARLGHRPEDVIGLDPLAMLPPDVATTRGAKLAQVRSSGEVINFTDARAGMELLSRIYPTTGGRLVIVATDVTAQNAAELALRKASQVVEGFIENLPGIVTIKDSAGKILSMNRRFTAFFKLAYADCIGRRMDEIVAGPEGAKLHAADMHILAGGGSETIEQALNGHVLQITRFAIPGEDGAFNLGAVSLDVTDRHTAEAALRESEELLRSLSEHLPESYLYRVVIHADGSRRFLFISRGVERIHGVSPAAVLADAGTIYGLLDPAQRAELQAQENRCVMDFTDFHTRVRMRRTDGRWGWMSLRSHPRRDGDDVVWDGVATDVTQIVESEQKLALLAERAAALLELPYQAGQLDEAAFLGYAASLVERLTGSQTAFIHFVSEDQQQLELAACVHADQLVAAGHFPRSGLWDDVLQAGEGRIINACDGPPAHSGLPGGQTLLRRLVGVPVVDGGKVCLLVGAGNKAEDYTATDLETVRLIASETWNIVHKERSERALAQTAEVVEASPAVCFRWRIEESWPVAFVSENVRRWGYEPADLMAGRPPFAELVHADDIGRIAAEVEDYLARPSVKQYAQEYRFIRADGVPIWVSDLTSVRRDAEGRAVEIYGVLTDISERKAQERALADALAAQQSLNRRLEEAHNQLLQTEKLAAIGQLAAGVAHELNNPIGFVHSNLGTLTEYCHTLIELCDTYSSLVEDRPSESKELAEVRRIKQDQDYSYLRGDIFQLLDESREGLQRVRRIVQDLRDFSRTGEQDWGFADLHKGLDSTLNIVANELKYKCTVRKEYGSIPEVYCVIAQLNQVFMNLLVNAAQAIESEGEIVLRSGCKGNDQVWISISDNGSGIAPEHLNRIFEPFFTTKPVGVGTGLGLSLVFGIINRHHGHIDVNSKPGVGTTFRVVLPIRQPVRTEDIPGSQETS